MTTKELFNDKNTYYQSLEFWAKEVDGSVYNNVNNDEWLDEQLTNCLDEDIIKTWLWNATSIGNIAYIALNAKNEKYKNICINCFNKVKKLLQQTTEQEFNDNLYTTKDGTKVDPNSGLGKVIKFLSEC